MNSENLDVEAKVRRKKAFPALFLSGLSYLLFQYYAGFGLGALLSLVIFLMIGWYVISIRAKLQRWKDEEGLVRDSKQKMEPIANEERVGSDGFVLDDESELWFYFPKSSSTSPAIAIAAQWDKVGQQFLKHHALQEQTIQLARRFDLFEAEVSEFLAKEMTRPEMRKFQGEISALVIQRISFLWSENPGDGVVHLDSPVSSYSWMCRLHEGRLVIGSLGFDT